MWLKAPWVWLVHPLWVLEGLVWEWEQECPFDPPWETECPEVGLAVWV